jgi:hypothetical protein
MLQNEIDRVVKYNGVCVQHHIEKELTPMATDLSEEDRFDLINTRCADKNDNHKKFELVKSCSAYTIL